MGEEAINTIVKDEHVEITDDFMFGYVMRNHPEVCREVIKCLMPDLAVADVKYRDSTELVPETQKTIQGNIGTRSVRLDVYLDDGETIYNVEIQTGNKANLPKRVRYYGGRIDCDQLVRSEDYNQLRPTYVIFICTFDPFNLDQYHYSFENTCAEVEGLKLGDESYKLFFNATGHKGTISDELKSFLKYVRDPKHMPEGEKTELVKKIDEIVEFANHDAEWRRGYMTYRQMQLDSELNGAIKMLISLVKDGLLSIKDASARAHMSEAEFAALVARA